MGGHGAGQVAKLCNNLIAGVTMVAAAEAFAMGQASGVDPKVLHEVIRTSSGGGWVMEKDPPCPGLVEGSPASRNFEAGFTVDLMLKDISLAVSALMALDPINGGRTNFAVFDLNGDDAFTADDADSGSEAHDRGLITGSTIAPVALISSTDGTVTYALTAALNTE